METNSVMKMTKGYIPNKNNSVYDDLFSQYRKVIITSLLTTFGLDRLLIEDRVGGDVDTIHNVRKIGVDSEMEYKNSTNRENYQNLEKYDNKFYHKHSNFSQAKHQVREVFKQDFKPIKDEYTEGEIGFYGKSKGIDPTKKAELDHILGASEIHQDRGRVLAGISGRELANSTWNFAWTNKSLNASMGAWAKNVNDEYRRKYGCDAPMDKVDMKAYIEAHPNLDETTKKNMMYHYEKAKNEYDKNINNTYYTSSSFRNDLLKASGKSGILLGLRESIGVILAEITFSLLEELENSKIKKLEDIFRNLVNGVKKGIENAKSKYKEIFSKFKDGFLAGVISSITTTLTNIFLTTSKNIIKIIRQVWVSLIEILKIIFINPDNLLFGERMKLVAKKISTCASLMISIIVKESLTKIGIGAIPIIGNELVTFIEVLTMGVTNCTLLYFIDNNEVINQIVRFLDKIPTMSNVINYYRKQAVYFEEYACEIMGMDIENYEKEVKKFNLLAERIDEIKDESELNSILLNFYKEMNIKLPWEGEFDSFMANRNNTLVFE